ncbi:MAG TPA: DNA-directed RNA polymerase subunit beta', partial [Candidatus Saccharimonadales bacterium]
RMLQEAADALIDNNNARSGRAVSSTGGRRRLKSLSDMLKGKQGRFRQNLLGKRVDYSGRSVIVSGPELRIHECGLPKLMALELFKPFVIGYLIDNEFAHNIKSATRMIEAAETAVWDALDHVIEGKYVLLNRAPSLHRLSIQAFQPKLIEGKAIQLHPLVCKGFNADFDGDQMAVHVPLSQEAQEEAANIMVASKNLLKPADGSPILHIEQDIVLGAYYLTNDPQKPDVKVKRISSLSEALHAHDNDDIELNELISVPFKGEVRQTTLGRILFNELFPDDFEFQNQPMTKKRIQEVMSKVYNAYGQEKTAEIADHLKDLSFQYATVSGLSMGMGDFAEIKGADKIMEEAEKSAAVISDEYEQGLITDEERYRLTVRNWMEADEAIQKVLSEQFAKANDAMATMVVSGARGSIGQVKQVTGSIGVLADATGRAIELPVRSNYRIGLTPLEYFTAARGARKGLIDTALRTADSGYLTRRLVDVSQDLFTTDTEHEDDGFTYFRQDAEDVGIDFGERMQGRFLASPLKDGKKTIGKTGQLIDNEIAKQIADTPDITEVTIKSVLTSRDERGIGPESYGIDLATGELVAPYQPIGVIAAQSIGEPGTQMTLKTFHAGGVAGEDITTGLPRIEELFEARTPKGQAFLSEIEGTVNVWEEGNNYIVQVLSDKAKTSTQKLGKRTASVKSGSEVSKGDVIASTGKDDKKPLLAKETGIAEVFDQEIIIASSEGSIMRYEIPNFKQLAVQAGDKVEKGGRLTAGSINLQELMELRGIAATQRYIINEVLRIFVAQGQTIADKHLEVIVRQMFSRVQIEDSGASAFVTGDIVSKAAVTEMNEHLKKSKKELISYKQLLLGITKVSTWSDSFLAAASFQDTTRVLINAAISGKVDKLYGLKENVIIGRRIPVGTGSLALTSEE